MLASFVIAAAASAASPQCAALDRRLPKEMSGWTKVNPSVGRIIPGIAYALPLRPTPMPQPAMRPPARGTKTFGGWVPLRIATPGRYGVALGERGWIDITRGKEPALKSISHGHGPDCTTIRKIVNFDLAAGNYLLQVSESPAATVKVMVIRR